MRAIIEKLLFAASSETLDNTALLFYLIFTGVHPDSIEILPF
jgi:hypothetical protein